MLIKIKTLKGEMTELEVPDDYTLLNLKTKLSEIKSHSIEHINIIYNGVILNPDTKTLKELSLTSGVTVVLLVKPPKTQVVEQSQQPVIPIQPQQPVQPTQQHQPVIQNIPQGNNLFDMAQQALNDTQGQPMNMHQAFTSALQQNPQLFMQMIMQDPVIQQMAQANPNAFQQMVTDPNFINNVIQASEQMGEYDEDGDDEATYQEYVGGQTNMNNLTESQKQDVDDIVNMGLGPYEVVLQYYVAFGYSKETTANHLLNEQLDNMN
ncbi:ubiquitin family protein [Indivirus ILV1]|uniref:Ubiquitin family protein n=1 Tax=Indivirus ILV1 TaxID=1977633 RepID=A0A1V0SDH8_9VIRU|nr:ubiquitin family protein [Indivirus ILV1]